MGSPGLDEIEIDSIFRRTQQTIDLSTIENKSDLKRTVRDYKKTNNLRGGWNNKLNDSVWERLETQRETGKEYWLNRAVSMAKSVFVGSSKNKRFQAIYNKKNGTARYSARDIKGRFTKFTISELNKFFDIGVD